MKKRRRGIETGWTQFSRISKNINDNIGNAMELAVKDLTAHITNHIPSAAEVDPKGILSSIRDPSCLILRDQTEEVRQKLEEIIPNRTSPGAKT